MTNKLNCPECGVPVDEHDAGRCLDAWIHSLVMGKRVYTQDELAERNERGHSFIIVTTIDGEIVNYDDSTIPRYSTDIAPSQRVVNKLDDDGKIISLNVVNRFIPKRQVVVVIEKEDETAIHNRRYITGKALTPPLAICRAKIKAVSND